MDVTQYLERCGVRRARFGGYEQEDVRQAVQALCTDFEQRLAQSEAELRTVRQENGALQGRCRTLAGQVQTLSTQNARLAGNTEMHARRGDELGSQLSSLQERNRSLNDQIARLKLQNGDLTRENSALQDRVQQAETTLRLKGDELDRQRDEVNATRSKTLEDARAQAQSLLADARAQADKTLEEARSAAEELQQSAREQATAQARRLVEAAAAEANEIQNAHQLRLNDLMAQVRRMEQRRDSLAGYLAKIGGELLETQTRVKETLPEEELPPPPLTLHPVEVPPLELDLSPRTVRPAPPPPQEPEPEQLPTQVVPAAPRPDAPEPDGTAPSPHQGFTLLHEEWPLDGSGYRDTARSEVPGEIFSYPIRHEEAAPLPGDVPAAVPRLPVLPVIPEDEEETVDDSAARVLDELNALGSRPAVPPPAPDRRLRGGAEQARRRRNAVRALNALRRLD